jgi:hypothetical protein
VNAISDEGEKTLNLAAQQAERDVKAIHVKSEKRLNLAAQQADRDVNAIRDKSERRSILLRARFQLPKCFLITLLLKLILNLLPNKYIFQQRQQQKQPLLISVMLKNCSSTKGTVILQSMKLTVHYDQP